ncbi:MAG: two-component sensor histidine kinase [Eubacterium sp.]|nr:two-component sensor histidine kinase [Eubacterium sp.]
MMDMGDSGEQKTDELKQFALELDGRALLIDSSYRVLADTYGQHTGRYYMARDILRALSGGKVSYKRIGDSYIQVITDVYEPGTEDVKAVIIAAASIRERNGLIGYLTGQRATLSGIFFLVSLLLSILIVLLLGRIFRRTQKELDLIAAGHQEENMPETGFREFYKLSVSFNSIINRYKELENSRQQFVSNVSHELKTPITSMKILADSLLLQENVPAELYAEFMNDIAHEIDRENQIITDLLDLVKMDKTQSDLNITAVNINELLEMILKRISPIAEKRDITLHLETMRQVTAEVDEGKLSLACTNLIENAVKYNNDGGRVDVSLNADHKFFYIRVKDTGVGIPEDAQEKIFERFYRVDKARSRETGGTGLGLAITRNVILLHKGSIRVHSKENEGSTFIVRIPLTYVGARKDV